MPMDVKDLIKYEEYEKAEIKISRFLETNRGTAFTDTDVYKGLNRILPFVPDEDGNYFTMQNAGSLILNVIDIGNYRDKLRQMAATGKIKMKIADGKEYFYFE